MKTIYAIVKDKSIFFRLAFIIVIAIVTIQIIDFSLLHSFRDKARAINMMEKQRVLSQRIIDQISMREDKVDTALLYQKANEWFFQHKILQMGSDSLKIPSLEDSDIQRVFNQATPHLMAIYSQIQDYRYGSSSWEKLQSVANKHEDRLLPLSKRAEALLAESSEESLVLAEEAQLLTIVIMVGFALSSYIFVIYPYTRKMKSQLLNTQQNRKEVISKNSLLSEQLLKVQKQNQELSLMKEQMRKSLEKQDTINHELNTKFVQLYNQKEQLDTAQQLANIGYWSSDFAKQSLVWSDRMYDIFGITRQKGTTGPSIEEFYGHIKAEEAPMVKEQVARAMEGEEVSYRHHIYRPSGEARTVFVSIKPSHDITNGAVSGIFGVVQDITDVVRREEEIATFNKSLKQIVNFSSQASGSFERSLHEILAYSTEALGMEQSLIGKEQWGESFAVYLSYSNIPNDDENLKGISVPLANSVFELPYKSKSLQIIADASGEEYKDLSCACGHKPMSYIGLPIRINQRIIGVLSFSSRKPLEREVTPYEQEYLRLLARVIGLVMDQYENKNKLEQANQDQENILHIVAHDVRSPLNKLYSLLEVVAQHPTSQEERQRYLELATEEYQGAIKLVEEMLDFFSTQKQTTQKEKTDISELYSGILDRAKPTFENKGVALKREIEADVQDWVYPNRLQRALDNLLSNALKFTPQGGEVAISLHSNDKNWVLSVKDSGIGIPTEMQPELFKKFNKKVRRKGLGGEKSTGLGMSIVKEIVEAHQGEIQLKSAKWKGTQITIRIPFQQ